MSGSAAMLGHGHAEEGSKRDFLNLVTGAGIRPRLGSAPPGEQDGRIHHGGGHDISGRVRHGPASANPPPPDAFDADTQIKIG
jgi:hypothetical protein